MCGIYIFTTGYDVTSCLFVTLFYKSSHVSRFLGRSIPSQRKLLCNHGNLNVCFSAALPLLWQCSIFCPRSTRVAMVTLCPVAPVFGFSMLYLIRNTKDLERDRSFLRPQTGEGRVISMLPKLGLVVGKPAFILCA